METKKYDISEEMIEEKGWKNKMFECHKCGRFDSTKVILVEEIATSKLNVCPYCFVEVTDRDIKDVGKRLKEAIDSIRRIEGELDKVKISGDEENLKEGLKPNLEGKKKCITELKRLPRNERKESREDIIIYRKNIEGKKIKLRRITGLKDRIEREKRIEEFCKEHISNHNC